MGTQAADGGRGNVVAGARCAFYAGVCVAVSSLPFMVFWAPAVGKGRLIALGLWVLIFVAAMASVRRGWYALRLAREGAVRSTGAGLGRTMVISGLLILAVETIFFTSTPVDLYRACLFVGLCVLAPCVMFGTAHALAHRPRSKGAAVVAFIAGATVIVGVWWAVRQVGHALPPTLIILAIMFWPAALCLIATASPPHRRKVLAKVVAAWGYVLGFGLPVLAFLAELGWVYIWCPHAPLQWSAIVALVGIVGVTSGALWLVAGGVSAMLRRSGAPERETGPLRV
mgnify:CR=1 FL=1